MNTAERLNSVIAGPIFSNLQHRQKPLTELWGEWSEVSITSRVARTAIGTALKSETASTLLIKRVFGGLPADMDYLIGCGSNSIVYAPVNDNSNVVKIDKRSVFDDAYEADIECDTQRKNFSLIQEVLGESVVSTDVGKVELTNNKWAVGIKQPKLEGEAVFGAHGEFDAGFCNSSYTNPKLIEFASKVREFEQNNGGLIIDIVGERNVLQTPADKIVLLDVGTLPGSKHTELHMSGRSIYEEYVFRLALLNSSEVNAGG